jgi:O-antigen chain-terminating methyltransferase
MFWQKETAPAISVKQLSRLDGKELIRKTYSAFLRRLPSPDEASSWRERLSSGLPVISFISSVRFSGEGKKIDEPVKCAFLLRHAGRLLVSKHIHGKIARFVLAAFQTVKTNNDARKALIRICDPDDGIDALATPPQLPFPLLTPSEPFLERAEKRVGRQAPNNLNDREALFYTYFSEMWGIGYEDTLLQHYRAYLPHIDKNLSASHPFLDIGCGAGEFLSFLKKEGVNSVGIDFNAQEAERCRQKGLDARCAEALDFLKDDGGLYCGISLLQVIEHIERPSYIELISLAKERLARDGVLILETINPLHARALAGFYTDPTHYIPVPSDYLAFLTQWCGFTKVDVMFLYPAVTHLKELNDEYYYANYAVLARHD